MPAGVYALVEATLYLATAPKSNSANDYFKAVNKVEEEGKVAVPQHLQDGTPSAGDARDLGHGEGYVYPHAEPGHHIGQQYLPTGPNEIYRRGVGPGALQRVSDCPFCASGNFHNRFFDRYST